MKKAILAVTLACALSLSACNGYDTAIRLANIIGAVLQVAQSEVAAVPAADQPAYSAFVTLGQTLEGQLQTCLAAANSGMSKSGKFLACFNGFAAGMSSPSEMAQLRMLSPATQKKAQLYITAISVGLNGAMAAYGGTQSAPPTITQATTKAELQELSHDPRITYAINTTELSDFQFGEP